MLLRYVHLQRSLLKQMLDGHENRKASQLILIILLYIDIIKLIYRNKIKITYVCECVARSQVAMPAGGKPVKLDALGLTYSKGLVKRTSCAQSSMAAISIDRQRRAQKSPSLNKSGSEPACTCAAGGPRTATLVTRPCAQKHVMHARAHKLRRTPHL